MFAFDLDDRAHRTALLDGHLLDCALEIFLAHLRVAGRRGAILAQQYQLARAQRLMSAARNDVDDVRTAARQAAHEFAGVDFDRAVRFLHAHVDRQLRGARSGNHFERSAAGCFTRRQRMRGPLERTVGPIRERPALQELELLVGAAQCEVFGFALFSARPRRAPGNALRNGCGLAVEPAHPGTGTGVRRRNDRR